MSSINQTSVNWWRDIVEKYETPRLASSAWQIINSVIPYLLLWCVMAWTITFSYPLTLALVLLTAGFWVRIFIISHDCGHMSFFKSHAWNNFWGLITGIITLTPYKYWRMEHAKHHGSSGNLDRRGFGDIWTLTVKEYQASSRWQRLKYRLYRNPLVMFGIGGAYAFTISYRFANKIQSSAERRSVHWTNLALVVIASCMIALIGFKHYLMIMAPLVVIGGGIGVWMFYVQHQFEGVYWERDDKWDYLKQAMDGSSFYKLPRVLQWFTGNIGFHHIHHLSHRIPNYNLPRCHYENEAFQKGAVITLWTSLKSLTFRLWDEDQHKLVGFGALKQYRI